MNDEQRTGLIAAPTAYRPWFMVIISEFLPNPIGKDPIGESIELFNNGASAQNLTGWKIKDASGKAYVFNNTTLEPSAYVVLDYKTTKITLNNSDESLFLYDQTGKLVDRAEFSGSAAAGKSLVRQGNRFVFTSSPTPGKANIFEADKTSQANNSQLQKLETKPTPESNSYLLGNSSQFNFGNIFIGVALSLTLAILFVVVYNKLGLSEDI